MTFLTSIYGVKMQREGVDVFLRPVIPAGRENMRAMPADDTGSVTELLSTQPQPSCAGCTEHTHKPDPNSKEPSGKHLPARKGKHVWYREKDGCK